MIERTQSIDYLEKLNEERKAMLTTVANSASSGKGEFLNCSANLTPSGE
jgi:hypothetical protein